MATALLKDEIHTDVDYVGDCQFSWAFKNRTTGEQHGGNFEINRDNEEVIYFEWDGDKPDRHGDIEFLVLSEFRG